MKPIDIKTFRHLLSVYGTDLSRWPDIDVKNVLAFIDDHKDAKAEFEQAGKLDDALALYAVPAFDAEGLMARINDPDAAIRTDMDMPAHIAAGADGGASRKFIWRAGMAFAACAVLMAVGVTNWLDVGESSSQKSAVSVVTKTAAKEDVNQEIDELLVIAANGYREQEQLQELMNVLGRDTKAKPSRQDSDVRENLDDAVNQWLEQEFNSLEGQGLWQDSITNNG